MGNEQNRNETDLVESFNRHYEEYLQRYSTTPRVKAVEAEPEVVESETTAPAAASAAPVSPVAVADEDDFFFSPEDMFADNEPEPLGFEDFASEGDEGPDAPSVPAETRTEHAPVEEAAVEVTSEAPAAEGHSEESSSDAHTDGFASDDDSTGEAPVAFGDDDEEGAGHAAEDHALLEDEEEDFFYTPESPAALDDDDEEELGFYDPEADQPENAAPAAPVVEEKAPEPAQKVVEREVVREVIVVDRDQARDLGYGAAESGTTVSSAPAASASPAAPKAPAFPSAPSYHAPSTAPAPSPVVRPAEPEDDYNRLVTITSRPAEKPSPGGFLSRLLGRGKADEADVHTGGASAYRESSRLRDEGGLAEGSIYSGSEDEVISLRTQENYDPREERRRLMHVTKEQRDVDPAVWLEQTMIDALKMDASDLHIVVDGETRDLRARIRVDGQMRDFDYVAGVPARVIMGRLKAATKLSSAGSAAPEETIYTLHINGEARKARAVLFRVEDGGEALVMRLPLTGNLRQLHELDFSEKNLQHVYDLLAMPYKLIMIAGPMGSGKTTTAHGALLHVADITRTVWTIEDPVERRLPNLVQLEIDEENGAGFDVLLAKLLRADYNTLFLGEIRDNATASAAVRQAKAGRQVMSTIHADDNIKSLMRLTELAGDSPMSVLSAVGGVISQRLVRRLNPNWDGKDMSQKYKGRVPIHEILFVDDLIVEVMMQDRPLSEIKQAVKNAKGSTFLEDAERLIAAGVTDRDEIVRVIGEYDAADRY